MPGAPLVFSLVFALVCSDDAAPLQCVLLSDDSPGQSTGFESVSVTGLRPGTAKVRIVEAPAILALAPAFVAGLLSAWNLRNQCQHVLDS